MTETAREVRERVGPYQLIRAIGAGGSARIDLARIDRAYNFQRHVVIKRPLEHLRGDARVAASLRREARIGGMLRHPNLIAVLDAGMHEGYDYLVLEYVHGTSLRALMQPEGVEAGAVRELPRAAALGIAIDVARGLHDAHELVDERAQPLGLVHRDVSPGNVLLGLDGAVKLADFGIAKETRVATLSGSMHGTVTYMAPEQCRGHAFDRRADVFSIGVILYELITRTRLFWADNDVASLHKVLSGQVLPPRRLDATISPALEEIVMTAVAHDPARRFASARQLADALEALAASEGHVVGARWIARALEEVVGPKHAPWIAATTVVDPPRAGAGSPAAAAASTAARSRETVERDSEPSLVAVIESLASEHDDGEPVYPTFGPRDERSLEEGSVPVPPSFAPVTADGASDDRAPHHASRATAPSPRPRSRRTRIAAIAATVSAGGIAIALIASKAATTSEGTAHVTAPSTPGVAGSGTSGVSGSARSVSGSGATDVSGSGATDVSGSGATDVSASGTAPSGSGATDVSASGTAPSGSATSGVSGSGTSAIASGSGTSNGSGSRTSGTRQSGTSGVSGTRPAGSHKGPHGHLTNAPDAGSNAGSAVSITAPSSDAAGSGAHVPANVEWKPTMLLPTDSGSGDKKKQ